MGRLKSSTTPLVVAVATTVDIDWLELSLGWNSHGSLDLDAKKCCKWLVRSNKIRLSFRPATVSMVKRTYSPDMTISGALTQIRGIFTVFWDSNRSCFWSSKAEFIKRVENAHAATRARKQPVVAHGLRFTSCSPQDYRIDSSGLHRGS